MDTGVIDREGSTLEPGATLFVPEGVALWTRRDLNPRPLRCERNDLPLIYEPVVLYYDFPADGI